MGTAWGIGAFENDTAYEWSAEATDAGDSGLGFVENTLSLVEEADDDELDADLACEAIAACEVIARLQGRGGRTGGDSAEFDAWIRGLPRPAPQLVKLAGRAMDRVISAGPELSALYDDGAAWLSFVTDLRKRVAG